MESDNGALDIAVIGIACQFPGAKNYREYWENLKQGKETISFFSDEELLDSHISEALLNQSNYIKAKGLIEGVEQFDAPFFYINGLEAELMDPQHRLYLQCAWSALEDAGYHSANAGIVGSFVGCGFCSYYVKNVLNNQKIRESVNEFQSYINNVGDTISTRLSYKFNLTGPSVTILTACSSGLVSLCTACDSLLNYHCDIALAGAVSIQFPHRSGYLYEKGMIHSPDGHCRPFDQKAQGTVVSEGLGVVVLKRLDEAIKDRDHIYAVIKGYSINNDGASKVSFTAPSIEGQASVILEAQEMAEIDPESLTFIEAHGTGTEMGDPIEVSALVEAFELRGTKKKQFCALGSVKSNIGHTDAAAGMAGFIKAVLSVYYGAIPPTLHFSQPNPKIDFENSPFYVNDRYKQWEGSPRRAGVSAFGIGGSNAHVILEEYVSKEEREAIQSPYAIVPLSAFSQEALHRYFDQLRLFLANHPETSIHDLSYTHQMGRKEFNYRGFFIASSSSEALAILDHQKEEKIAYGHVEGTAPDLVFMFPGQGSQYQEMGHELYQYEPVFRSTIDYCAEYLKPILEIDVRYLIYPKLYKSSTPHSLSLNDTVITQAAVFIVDYAMAQLLISWGFTPNALIGHSLGEYVAACVSGVFSLDEALNVIALRGKLIQSLPKGAMLAVQLSQEELAPYLSSKISLAAVNLPNQCVLSGSIEEIKKLEAQFLQEEVVTHLLKTSHAFHSSLLDPILDDFETIFTKIDFKEPQIPYISNQTGTWIRNEEATSPIYWRKHLRETVLFAQGIKSLLEDDRLVLLEVGAGNILSHFAHHFLANKKAKTVSSLPPAHARVSEMYGLLKAVGQLWIEGVPFNWQSFNKAPKGEKISLPTYPFDPHVYWINPDPPLNRNDIRTGQEKAEPESVEKILIQLWEKYLNPSGALGRLNSTQNYFDLGGDSLLAIQIFREINKIFDVKIDPHELIAYPTIQALASLIEQIKGGKSLHGEDFRLVTLKKGDSEDPIFLIHAISGHLLNYKDLIKSLDVSCPIYGLTRQGVDERRDLSVEEMASLYIDKIDEIIGSASYRLVGHSFGGTLAYEMARQLVQRGSMVSFLALIDTPGFDQMPPVLADNAEILAYLLNVGNNHTVSAEYLRSLSKKDQVSYYLQHSLKTQAQKDLFDPSAVDSSLKIFNANMKAMFAYQPQLIDIVNFEFLFFKAKIRDYINPKNPEKGWKSHFRDKLKLYEVSGNHMSVMDAPHIQEVAKMMEPYLKAHLRTGHK